MGEINGPDPADGASGALGKEGVPSHGGLVASFDDDAHSAGEDSLTEIDQSIDHWSCLRQRSAEEQAHAEVESGHFL
jgi:hypothetical protein